MKVEPHELLEKVKDRASFLIFVAALIADRKQSVEKERQRPSSPYGPDANGWENTTIEAFVDAAFRWAEDSEDLPEEPSWKAFATFLYCGKIYE